MIRRTQDEEVAAQLQAAYLPWLEKKQAADNKWLTSILKVWGFR